MKVLLLLPLLAGCVCNPARVEIPVPVPCVSKLPEPPEQCKPLDDSRPEYLRCVLIESERNKGYTNQLRAALTGCVGNQ